VRGVGGGGGGSGGGNRHAPRPIAFNSVLILVGPRTRRRELR